MHGDAQRAARLFGATEALRQAINLPIRVSEFPDYDRWVAAARGATDADSFAAAWKEGAAMTLEQAIELALVAPVSPAVDRKGRTDSTASQLSASESRT